MLPEEPEPSTRGGCQGVAFLHRGLIVGCCSGAGLWVRVIFHGNPRSAQCLDREDKFRIGNGLFVTAALRIANAKDTGLMQRCLYFDHPLVVAKGAMKHSGAVAVIVDSDSVVRAGAAWLAGSKQHNNAFQIGRGCREPLASLLRAHLPSVREAASQSEGTEKGQHRQAGRQAHPVIRGARPLTLSHAGDFGGLGAAVQAFFRHIECPPTSRTVS